MLAHRGVVYRVSVNAALGVFILGGCGTPLGRAEKEEGDDDWHA